MLKCLDAIPGEMEAVLGEQIPSFERFVGNKGSLPLFSALTCCYERVIVACMREGIGTGLSLAG